MNNLMDFSYEGRQVRTVVRDREPWFVAKDVCDVLELGNSRQALTRLDEDEKGVISTDTLGGNQEMAIINEPGLYSLIFGSRKPEARQFKRWVTHEVLPAIRRTGGYGDMAGMVLQAVQTTAAGIMKQVVPVIVEIVRQEAPARAVDHSALKSFLAADNANRCKLETFPLEITSQVDDMLRQMEQSQKLNYSLIARFCTMNGYAISSTSVRNYYQRKFVEA